MARQRKTEAIWIETESRWLMQIQVNGVRKKFYSSIAGKKGKIQAEKKADEWLNRETFVENTKVKDLFDDFIKNMKEQDLEYNQYESIGKNWIIPIIGKKKFENITDSSFQDILNAAYKKGLAKKTLQNIRGCCTAFLKYARQHGATNIRPELIVNRKAPTYSKRALEDDEINTIFSCDKTLRKGKIADDWHRYMYRFAIATGLRPGELCGLKKSDIKDNYLHVQRSYNARQEFTQGKNENANRHFKLNDVAISILDQQLKMLHDNDFDDIPWLFPLENGLATPEQTYYRRFLKYCNYNGISHITPYEMRHTYVSVNKDMPEELLKIQVGHSKSMQTRDQYSHQRIGDSEIAAEYSSAALQKIIKK